jgi:hypothetical protein
MYNEFKINQKMIEKINYDLSMNFGPGDEEDDVEVEDED